MRKISSINESSPWIKPFDRAMAGMTRKEDMIGNLNSIKWIDTGDSVLWSDRDLEIDGNVFFNWNKDVRHMKLPKGVRIPTLKEWMNLAGIDKIILNDKARCKNVSFFERGMMKINDLEFPLNGYVCNGETYNSSTTYTLYFIDNGKGDSIEFDIKEDGNLYGWLISSEDTYGLKIRLVKEK